MNYFDTFANTTRPDLIRTLFAIAARLDLDIRCWDIKQAFPNALIDTTIFVEQPEGFQDPRYPQHVCLLNKALYGLKQASRQWQKLLCDLLSKLGFKPLLVDTATYIHYNKKMIIATHVDDLLIFAANNDQIDQLYQDLSGISNLQIKDLGDVTQYLGVQVIRDRSKRTIYLTQEAYIQRLLSRFSKTEIKPRYTPLQQNIKLQKYDQTALP